MHRENSIIICRCEEVTKREILQAIKDGARSVDEAKRMTRAGMGLCQSKVCYKLIARLIREMTGKPLANIPPFTKRPPIRPLPAETLANLDHISE